MEKHGCQALAVVVSMEKQFASHLERSMGAGAAADDDISKGIPAELHTWVQMFKVNPRAHCALPTRRRMGAVELPVFQTRSEMK